MDTTTTTPSNGEALLTFEQQTIRDLIVLEHQRLHMEERIALGKLASEQKQLALQERFADERAKQAQQTSDQIVHLVTILTPIVASLFPRSEDGSKQSGRRRRVRARQPSRPGTVDDLIDAIAHHEASANDDGTRDDETDDAPRAKSRAAHG